MSDLLCYCNAFVFKYIGALRFLYSELRTTIDATGFNRLAALQVV